MSGATGAGATPGEFEKVIFNDVGMRRAISRIAHEIVERNGGAGELTLLGLRTRGGPIARRLAESIRELEGVEPPVAELDVSDYRDDLPDRSARSRTFCDASAFARTKKVPMIDATTPTVAIVIGI